MTAYRLRLNAIHDGGMLAVVPQLAAPAGSRLRYEMASTKEGASGKSITKQSGHVAVGEVGLATISSLSLRVAAQDRYTITMKLFDGEKLVAQQTLQYPH